LSFFTASQDKNEQYHSRMQAHQKPDGEHHEQIKLHLNAYRPVGSINGAMSDRIKIMNKQQMINQIFKKKAQVF